MYNLFFSHSIEIIELIFKEMNLIIDDLKVMNEEKHISPHCNPIYVVLSDLFMDHQDMEKLLAMFNVTSINI